MSPRRRHGPSPALGLSSTLSPSAEGHADDCEVVRLGASAGERDVRGAHAEHLRHASTGIGEGFGGSAPEFVVARRVAERPCQIRPSGLEGFPAHGAAAAVSK